MPNFRLFLCVLLATAASAQTVDYVITAAPGTTTVAPGVVIPALLYNGQLPAPVITATQGQTLRVRFINNLPTYSSMHWHGLFLPSGMDGVIGVSRPAVAPGQEFIYEFVLTHSGTYWFHPHVEDQLTSGMYGALIVHPANPAADPSYDMEQLVILHDNTTAAGGMTGGFTSHLMNGRTSAGQTPLLVQPGQRLRLRIINASALTNYVVALDGHQLEVTHSDGHRVQSVNAAAIPIGIGERYDAIVTLNNPGTWSLAVADILSRTTTRVRGVIQYSNSTQPIPAATAVPTNLATGALLSYAQLAAYTPQGAISSTPSRNYNLTLGMGMGSGGMVHTINGQAWPNVTPFAVNPLETVQLNFTNAIMEYHPMHIHGHFWRLMGTAGGTAAPPIKDTVLVRPIFQAGSTASVQFLANNPGEWVIHCHNADHMMTGMMNTFQYGGDADGDGIATAQDWDPLTANPVLTIGETATSFTLGSSGLLTVQVAAGSIVDYFIGAPALTPFVVAPYGIISIDSPFQIGTSMAGAGQVATLGYTIPNAPILSGLRIGVQGVAWVSFSPGMMLTTWHPFTIH